MRKHPLLFCAVIEGERNALPLFFYNPYLMNMRILRMQLLQRPVIVDHTTGLGFRINAPQFGHFRGKSDGPPDQNILGS